MFDFSIGEIAVIGVVALVVLGPERMPQGRAHDRRVDRQGRSVTSTKSKSDISREMELAELKKLQEGSAVRRAVNTVVSAGLQADLHQAASDLQNPFEKPMRQRLRPATMHSRTRVTNGAAIRFSRRYKPGPSIDDLAEGSGAPEA